MFIRLNEKKFQSFIFMFSLLLTWRFILLGQHCIELFSNKGQLADANLNLTYPFFPNILYFFDGPLFLQFFTYTGAFLSLCLMFKQKLQILGPILWYFLACLFHRNNLIADPSLSYLGMILFSFMFLTFNNEIKISRIIYYGLWLALGLSYFSSGMSKIQSVSWQNGEAIGFILKGPLARQSSLAISLLGWPEVLKYLSHLALFLEFIFIFLIFTKITRYLAFILSILMHFGILLMIDFTEVSISMMLVHYYLWEPYLGENKEYYEKA